MLCNKNSIFIFSYYAFFFFLRKLFFESTDYLKIKETKTLKEYYLLLFFFFHMEKYQLTVYTKGLRTKYSLLIRGWAWVTCAIFGCSITKIWLYSKSHPSLVFFCLFLLAFVQFVFQKLKRVGAGTHIFLVKLWYLWNLCSKSWKESAPAHIYFSLTFDICRICVPKIKIYI